MAKVLVNWRVTPEEVELIRRHWPAELEVVIPQTWQAEELRELVRDVEVVVGGLSPALAREARRLVLVHTLGHGVDNLAGPEMRELLRERGVTVAKANPAAVTIAEFVLMAMVALTRRVFRLHEALAYHGSWSEEIRAGRMRGSLGGEVAGSTVGLLGFGAIGQEVARRALAFGAQVGALVRRPERLDLGAWGLAFAAGPGEIDAFLGRCDYVVVCLPLTPETRGLLDQGRFQAMKDGAYLIQVARGPIVVEEALWEALRTGKLAGAAIDVWCAEEQGGARSYPVPFPLHPYNVIMTPHYAGATRESRERALRHVGENLRRWLAGEPLRNVADLEAGF